MTNPTCERCERETCEPSVRNPGVGLHKEDCAGLSSLRFCHGHDQPQQERSEEIYGIMFKDKDGQFVMSNSETAHDFLKRKTDKARADERKKVVDEAIELMRSVMIIDKNTLKISPYISKETAMENLGRLSKDL